MSILRVTWVTLLIFHIVMIPLVSPADDTAPDIIPTLEQILDRYVKAVGGEMAIKKLKTRTCTGWQIDDRPYRGPVKVTPLESYSTVPDKCVFILYYQKVTHKEGFDGEVGWHQNSQGIVRDDSKARSKLAWIINPQGPLRIKEYFAGMEVRGKETIGERLVYLVETDRDKAYFSLWFDAITGLLARIGYYWELQDYREVDGVLIPFRIVRGRKGGATTWVFDKVEHNQQIDDSLLEMPQSSPRPSKK